MNLVLEVFCVFARLSFISLGGVFGVLPELEHELVIQHGWMTHERFLQAYAAASFVPGPNMAMCPLIGYWVAGVPGWFAAFLGIYLPPLAIMGTAYAVYSRARSLPTVKRIEIALRPVVIGLLIAAGLHIFWEQTAIPPRALVSEWYPWWVRPTAIIALYFGVRFLRAKPRLDPVLFILIFGVFWIGVETSAIAWLRR